MLCLTLHIHFYHLKWQNKIHKNVPMAFSPRLSSNKSIPTDMLHIDSCILSISFVIWFNGSTKRLRVIKSIFPVPFFIENLLLTISIWNSCLNTSVSIHNFVVKASLFFSCSSFYLMMKWLNRMEHKKRRKGEATGWIRKFALFDGFLLCVDRNIFIKGLFCVGRSRDLWRLHLL